MVSSNRLVERLAQAFLDHGYERLTMGTIARACGITRRALYNHYRNKEDAFRCAVALVSEQAIEAGFQAARRVLDDGGDAVAVLSTLLDVRYGDMRRRIMRSAHAVEISEQSFRRCGDLIDQSAIAFQARLAGLIVELAERGRFSLGATSPARLAQLLADGARGVNQSRPPVPAEQLRERYQSMCEAILFGTVEPPEPGRSHPSDRSPSSGPSPRTGARRKGSQ